MIDAIVGLATLPIGILLFLNSFGVIKSDTLFGFPLLLVGAAALVANQVANQISSHIEGHHLLVSYSAHFLLVIPAIIYGLSLLFALPAALMGSLKLIFACFLFVEGIYSLFIFT